MLDKELLKLIKGNRKYIAYATLIQIVGMLANIGITAAICFGIYIAAFDADNSRLILAFSLIGGGIIVRCISALLTARFKTKLGAVVKKDLRSKVYGKILRLNTKSTGDMSMAGLTQVSTEGIEQLDAYYTNFIPQFFYSMIAPIILFVICVFIDWRTALVLLAGVPIIPVSIILISKYAKKVFAKYWGKYTSMGDSFLDGVQGMKELKIFNADARRNKKMNKDAEEFRRITMKVLVMQLASTTIMDMVAFGVAGAGAAVAIFSALNHGLNPILALFLILVSVEFFLPLRSLGSAFHVAMNGASAGRKILTLLNTEEPKWGDNSLPKGRDITLDAVEFSYTEDKKILDNVSMKFSQTHLTAIVGESGSGKSTIVSLLTGANRPSNGKVALSDSDLYALSQEEYFKRVAVVGYNTYIFNDSVRNNFMLVDPDVNDERIWGALKRADLDTFIHENGGLDKVISEDADNISGGQKQRLALAVNLVAEKDIYIFDEATSNIDVVSEGIIMQNIHDLKQSASVILISHRLENVVHADTIYVLKDGQVAQHGVHKELLENDGEYARLYKAQKSLELGFMEVKSNA